MKLQPDTEVYHSSATKRKADQQTIVHLEKDCTYLQRTVDDIKGPKPYAVCRDDWQLCQKCDPDATIGGRRNDGSDLYEQLADEDFTVDDVDMLTNMGDRDA